MKRKRIKIPRGFRRLKRGEIIEPSDLIKFLGQPGWTESFLSGIELEGGCVIRKIK